jgi:F420H(2)-dependent quinone reductase
LADNGAEQFLYLTTRGWKTGKEHRIEIWFVEDYGLYYVMSERTDKSHWVQNILHNPAVTFSVFGRQYRGRARVIGRKGDNGRALTIAGLMKQKYDWDDGLIIELTPEK